MLPEINLLPKYERQNSVAYIIFIVGIAVCLILFTMMAFFYFNTKGNIEETRSNIEQLEQDKGILEAKLTSDGDHLASYDTAFNFAEHHVVPTADFIDELVNLQPDHSFLNEYDYNYQSIDIEVQFEEKNAAADYVVALNDSNYVEDVQVNEMDIVELMQSSEADADQSVFDELPRYQVTYSVNIDQAYAKEEGGDDE